MINMKENKILFSTDVFFKEVEDIEPIPAVRDIPEWYKKLSAHVVGKLNIKGCQPVQDALTSGYLLRLPQDMEIAYNFFNKDIGKKVISVNFAMENSHFYHNLLQANPQAHDTAQVGGENSFLAQKNSSHGKASIPKIINPFKILTPPGYSCLFLPPLLREYDHFHIIPGVVDTDTYHQTVNFPFTFNKDKYPSYKKIFKRGTPYVQVIPFKRNNWKMEIEYKEDFRNANFNWGTKIIHRYKQLFWNKKKYS